MDGRVDGCDCEPYCVSDEQDDELVSAAKNSVRAGARGHLFITVFT